jgi:2,3-dihydroxybenzoate-AMP ligase
LEDAVLAGCRPWPQELAERYRSAGYWRGEVLGDLLRDQVAQGAGERVAVVAGQRRRSYAELDATADRLAAGLAGYGVRAGDRVVVQLPNSPEFVTVSVALFRLGALPIYALPAHRRAEISYLCRSTGAVAYVIPDVAGRFDFRDLAREVRAEVPDLAVLVAGEPAEFTALAQLECPPRELPRPDPGEVAFFLLSGGTTGLPKLIPRTHDDYAYQLRATAQEMGFTADGVYLACLPVAHNAALGCPGLLGALRAGGRVVLAASPSPDEVFPLIAAEGVTLTTLMPAFLPLWAELRELSGVDLSGLTIEVGGAPLDPAVARRVDAALGARLTRWFGMAEGLLVFTRPEEPAEVRASTEGRPLCPDDELRVVDEQDRPVPRGEVGELHARGPCLLRGYYRAEEYNDRVFTADGYLRTGDLVRLDEAGRLVVAGRIKDVINRGGEKVAPEEVESHLLHHPLIREVSVVGVPDRVLGEKTCAVVVAPDGALPTLASVKELLTGRGLAGYKLPDRLEVVDSLPRTSLGKVDRKALRAVLLSRPRRAPGSA